MTIEQFDTKAAVQALLDDPLDYSSYTIGECRVLQAELRRLHAVEQQRDELLELLERVSAQIGNPQSQEWLPSLNSEVVAAIAKATGAHHDQ